MLSSEQSAEGSSRASSYAERVPDVTACLGVSVAEQLAQLLGVEVSLVMVGCSEMPPLLRLGLEVGRLGARLSRKDASSSTDDPLGSGTSSGSQISLGRPEEAMSNEARGSSILQGRPLVEQGLVLVRGIPAKVSKGLHMACWGLR